MYKVYVELDNFGETYEISLPNISGHNLIIGNVYMDMGGKSIIRNCSNKDEQCILKYETRGWTSSNAFKVEGEVLSGKNVEYKIGGKWSESISIQKKIGPKEFGEKITTWVKTPYPENWEY